MPLSVRFCLGCKPKVRCCLLQLLQSHTVSLVFPYLWCKPVMLSACRSLGFDHIITWC